MGELICLWFIDVSCLICGLQKELGWPWRFQQADVTDCLYLLLAVCLQVVGLVDDSVWISVILRTECLNRALSGSSFFWNFLPRTAVLLRNNWMQLNHRLHSYFSDNDHIMVIVLASDASACQQNSDNFVHSCNHTSSSKLHWDCLHVRDVELSTRNSFRAVNHCLYSLHDSWKPEIRRNGLMAASQLNWRPEQRRRDNQDWAMNR